MINAGSCFFLECIVFNCALLALRQLRETIILRPTAMTGDFTYSGLISSLSYKIKAYFSVIILDPGSWQLRYCFATSCVRKHEHSHEVSN